MLSEYGRGAGRGTGRGAGRGVGRDGVGVRVECGGLDSGRPVPITTVTFQAKHGESRAGREADHGSPRSA